MNDANLFQNTLSNLTQALRELELLYEQYFSGQEKRAPLRQRQQLEKQLRRLSRRRIIKSVHRFQFETLSMRYHTYAANWDRMQRRLDEGRCHRPTDPQKNAPALAAPQTVDPDEAIYRNVVEAHLACNLPDPPPGRRQFANFLDRQKKHLRERWGNRRVDFRVVIENGKPKLKVRRKK
jgi:hypothetical protein